MALTVFPSLKNTFPCWKWSKRYRSSTGRRCIIFPSDSTSCIVYFCASSKTGLQVPMTNSIVNFNFVGFDQVFTYFGWQKLVIFERASDWQKNRSSTLPDLFVLWVNDIYHILIIPRILPQYTGCSIWPFRLLQVNLVLRNRQILILVRGKGGST